MAAKVDLGKSQYKVEDTEITTGSTLSPIGPGSSSESDEESVSRTSHNIFSDPKVLAHYTTIYEKANYECRHVLDPNLEWSREEERKLVRKLDWHVCLWAVR